MAHSRLAPVALLLALGAFQARADLTLSNLTVDEVVPGEGGIYLRLLPAPSACSGGSYRTTHAFIPSSAERFDELYALAANAQALGNLVTITYTDRGNCTHHSTTLFLSDLQ